MHNLSGRLSSVISCLGLPRVATQTTETKQHTNISIWSTCIWYEDYGTLTGKLENMHVCGFPMITFKTFDIQYVETLISKKFSIYTYVV